MVTVSEAAAIVQAHTIRLNAKAIPVHEAIGKVLAEPILADRDLPPINRVTMDGIAVSHAAWQAGNRSFVIAGVLAAGAAPVRLDSEMACWEVMTGAALPAGADTVIPYEEIGVDAGKATITAAVVQTGQHVHRRGSDAREGELLLTPGTIISPAEVALLATVGKGLVAVYDYPTAAVVSTGDELVDIHETPAEHQVRRSNSYALQSAMAQMGWHAELFHLADNREQLTEALAGILREFDVVILSGGVSKGKYDFVPEALASAGIVKRFHRVSQRPGKPFWFGTSASGMKTVFALPGNPVSTYLCFYRYVRPWLLTSQQVDLPPQFAVLAEDFAGPPGLTYFLQVAVRNEHGILKAYPRAGGGSGDHANLRGVTGFIEIPPSTSSAPNGQAFAYFPFR